MSGCTSLWTEADGLGVAWALFHCALGDVVIALGAFLLASIVLGRIDWPLSRPGAGNILVVAVAGEQLLRQIVRRTCKWEECCLTEAAEGKCRCRRRKDSKCDSFQHLAGNGKTGRCGDSDAVVCAGWLSWDFIRSVPLEFSNNDGVSFSPVPTDGWTYTKTDS